MRSRIGGKNAQFQRSFTWLFVKWTVDEPSSPSAESACKSGRIRITKPETKVRRSGDPDPAVRRKPVQFSRHPGNGPYPQQFPRSMPSDLLSAIAKCRPIVPVGPLSSRFEKPVRPQRTPAHPSELTPGFPSAIAHARGSRQHRSGVETSRRDAGRPSSVSGAEPATTSNRRRTTRHDNTRPAIRQPIRRRKPGQPVDPSAAVPESVNILGSVEAAGEQKGVRVRAVEANRRRRSPARKLEASHPGGRSTSRRSGRKSV